MEVIKEAAQFARDYIKAFMDEEQEHHDAMKRITDAGAIVVHYRRPDGSNSKWQYTIRIRNHDGNASTAEAVLGGPLPPGDVGHQLNQLHNHACTHQEVLFVDRPNDISFDEVVKLKEKMTAKVNESLWLGFYRSLLDMRIENNPQLDKLLTIEMECDDDGLYRYVVLKYKDSDVSYIVPNDPDMLRSLIERFDIRKLVEEYFVPDPARTRYRRHIEFFQEKADAVVQEWRIARQLTALNERQKFYDSFKTGDIIVD
jgi:hypothetical protein